MTAQDTEAALDPRGLIAEAYKMDGVTEPDCRSIFFDWALGLPEEVDQRSAIETLLAARREAAPDHPMTLVLLEGINQRDGLDARPRRSRTRRRDG